MLLRKTAKLALTAVSAIVPADLKVPGSRMEPESQEITNLETIGTFAFWNGVITADSSGE